MAKNTRESVIPDVYEGYVLTDEDKKILAQGGSVRLPSLDRELSPGFVMTFELLIVLNLDTDMYECKLGYFDPYIANLDRSRM